MKRLAEEENAPTFVVLSVSAGSLRASLRHSSEERSLALAQSDKCWYLSALDARAAQANEEKD